MDGKGDSYYYHEESSNNNSNFALTSSLGGSQTLNEIKKRKLVKQELGKLVKKIERVQAKIKEGDTVSDFDLANIAVKISDVERLFICYYSCCFVLEF